MNQGKQVWIAGIIGSIIGFICGFIGAWLSV